MSNNGRKKALIPQGKSSWFSWIPTNIGYLNFNYIADERSLISVFGKNNFKLEKKSNINLTLYNTNLSDLNPAIRELFIKEEIPCIAKLRFNNISHFNNLLNKTQSSGVKGHCNLYYKDSLSLLMKVNSKFKIQSNGKIEIYDFKIIYNSDKVEDINLEDDNTILNTIVNALYTLIKKVSHGDNHHFQKIDTMIGVYTKFVPEQILTDLGFQIKRIDKFVKSNEKSVFDILYHQDKSMSDIMANGFMSYINTFYELFLKTPPTASVRASVRTSSRTSTTGNKYIKYENIVNTVQSINAGVQKHKQVLEKKKNAFTFVLSMFALVAAYNILFSNLIPENCNSYSSIGVFLISYLSRDAIILLFAIIIFTPVIKGYVVHYITNLFRQSMNNPNNYSFIELLIIKTYIKANDYDKDLNSNDNYQNNLKLINNFINEYVNIILILSIYIFVIFVLLILNLNEWIPLPIIFMLTYTILKISKFKKFFGNKR